MFSDTCMLIAIKGTCISSKYRAQNDQKLSCLPLTFHNLWGLLWSLSFYLAFLCLPMTFHILWGRFWHFDMTYLEFPFLTFDFTYLNSPGPLLTFHTWTSHICTARVSHLFHLISEILKGQRWAQHGWSRPKVTMNQIFCDSVLSIYNLYYSVHLYHTQIAKTFWLI